MSEPGQSVAMLSPPAGVGEKECAGGPADRVERDSSGKSVPWGATWILLLSLSAVGSSLLVMRLHAERGFFCTVLAVAVCMLAALFDAWQARIPNPLTYTAILLGLGINSLASLLQLGHAGWMISAAHLLGAAGIGQSAAGFGVCAALGILGMTVARVGGGDIKLLAALGALLGLWQVASVVVVALGVAVVYAVINLAAFGKLNAFARVVAIRMLEGIYLRRLELPAEVTSEAPPARRDLVPMAVPLAIGLIVAQVLGMAAWLGGHR